MALQFQFAFRDGNKLETIVVDASVSESHSFAAEVTDYPVEKGANVADNIRAKPTVLRLEAFISDAPLTNAGRNQVASGGVTPRPKYEPNRSQDVLNQLIRLRDEGVLVTVYTGIKKYENMLLQSIDMPRDKSLKAGLRLTLTFKETRIVETQKVTITKAKERKGEKAKKDGPQTGKEAGEEKKKKSLAIKVSDSAYEALKKVLAK